MDQGFVRPVSFLGLITRMYENYEHKLKGDDIENKKSVCLCFFSFLILGVTGSFLSFRVFKHFFFKKK